MLNNVWDRTPPFGTPVLICHCVDVFMQNVVYALRTLM